VASAWPSATRPTCAGFDSGEVSIALLLRPVNNALNGCGPIGPYDGRPPALSFARVVHESPKVLDRVSAVVVSPDGAQLYAANSAGTLIIFARGTDGRVAFAGSVAGCPQYTESMTTSADGLAGATAVVVCPDNEWVYVAAPNESAIGIFHVDHSPVLRDGAACDFDEDCASGVCDFFLRGPNEGGQPARSFRRSAVSDAVRSRRPATATACANRAFPS
jgi:hypothetical protein